MTAVKLLEAALQANCNHLPSWMVRQLYLYLGVQQFRTVLRQLVNCF
jgi:hypothetical protein